MYANLLRLVETMRKLQVSTDCRAKSEDIAFTARAYSAGQRDTYKACADLLEDLVRQIAK